MRNILSFGFLLLCFSFSSAQNASVKGRLFGNNEALPGATVKIEGTTSGAITEMDGSFIITNLSAGKKTLVFTYLGFITLKKEIDLSENQKLDLGKIELKESALQLKDVEVTGRLR